MFECRLHPYEFLRLDMILAGIDTTNDSVRLWTVSHRTASAVLLGKPVLTRWVVRVF